MCEISGVKFSSKFFPSIKGTASKKMSRNVIIYGLYESAILFLTDEPKFDPPFFTLTRALRARRARPPEVPENNSPNRMVKRGN